MKHWVQHLLEQAYSEATVRHGVHGVVSCTEICQMRTALASLTVCSRVGRRLPYVLQLSNRTRSAGKGCAAKPYYALKRKLPAKVQGTQSPASPVQLSHVHESVRQGSYPAPAGANKP